MTDAGVDDFNAWPPTRAAALARLHAVQPAAYARTRNHLDGAVTRLSPYLTHGLLTIAEVLAHLRSAHGLDLGHKLVQELGWRAWFHHAWRHLGDGILQSLHPGPLPDDAYAPVLPEDIRRGATGVPVVDLAVRTLYATGWLHNHARLWLASYVVHLRKVRWRAGADWLYGHLLDGDLASNHLSWQWVAGTGSSKPYLFNAENVARFAPAPWHSAGTVVDASYEALQAIAHAPRDVGGGLGVPVDEPALLHAPPRDVSLTHEPPPAGAWLVHPWALGEPPADRPRASVFLAGFHERWAWSERRWRFVAARMRELGAAPRWLRGPLPADAATRDEPHARPWLQGIDARPDAPAFPEPKRPCTSYSQYWRQVTRGRAGPG